MSVLPPPAPDLLVAGGLPQAWAKQPSWQVLDADFAGGHLLAAWAAWRADPNRPRQLHWVSWLPSAEAPLWGPAPSPELLPLAQQFAAQSRGLLPGVHRLVFEDQALLVTLCVGQLPQVLRGLQCRADSVLLGAPPAEAAQAAAWLQTVARSGRHGATVSAVGPWAPESFRTAGLQVLGVAAGRLQSRINPPWAAPLPLPPTRPGRCIVIGAGLAGAACAASLARRGWDVLVLDAQGPAAGASGLPVGLMAPHVSPDDGLLSRLSRAGLRATWAEAQRLLQPGQDFATTGVLQRRLLEDGPGGALPRHWPEAGRAWTEPADTAAVNLPADLRPRSLWHASGGWLRPARLVNAWLSEPGIALRAPAAAHRLARQGGQWRVLDDQEQCLAEADAVVLASGHSSQALLEGLTGPLSGLQAVRGQVSWGSVQAGDALLPVPVNGHGSLVSFPQDNGRAWLLGATFERDETSSDVRAEGHAANLAKLRALLPETAARLAPRFAQGQVQGWAGVRCSYRDHLPLVGPVDEAGLPGLLLCTGFASRGLSYSALCAELLAARLHAEPLPMAPRLAQALRASRLLEAR